METEQMAKQPLPPFVDQVTIAFHEGNRRFEPQENITAYELARATRLMLASISQTRPMQRQVLADLPEGVRRHFVE
jgi:hypothetical protein